MARYEAEGRCGLQDRSRAPHHCPHRIDDALAELICALRRQHPFWGARKLLRILETRHPRVHAWPAPSTAADLLARRGLVQKRRRRRPHQHPGVVPATTAEPNDRWTADFKGQFRTGSSVPFATTAIHGLSYLNVWWMRLGIQHQRINPGRPQENGAHERMHRTLKRQATKPVQRTCARQQHVFDAFRIEYNEVRPHEWLNQETPASHYTASPRAYPERLPALEYPGHFVVKKITTGGTFRFQKQLLYLANAMVDQLSGLEETDDGVWSIYLNTVLLATLDEREYIIRG